jgi:hypothetical protein
MCPQLIEFVGFKRRKGFGDKERSFAAIGKWLNHFARGRPTRTAEDANSSTEEESRFLIR